MQTIDTGSVDWWAASDEAIALHQQMIEAHCAFLEACSDASLAHDRYEASKQKWLEADSRQQSIWHRWLEERNGIAPQTHQNDQQSALHMPETYLDTQTRQAGQGIIEYTLILMLVAMVVLISLIWFGPQLSQIFQTITAGL